VAEDETRPHVGAQRTGSSEAKEAPVLDMDRLLQVPRSGPYPAAELRGGKDRETWTDEFVGARVEVRELRARIEATTTKLREIAPSDWSFSPSGTGAQSDPDVIRLRSELRRDRQSLETAERRLRDLEIEASLAGVPDEWRIAPEKTPAKR
jgi:hypothetical protein